jgi:hypothetical protein
MPSVPLSRAGGVSVPSLGSGLSSGGSSSTTPRGVAIAEPEKRRRWYGSPLVWIAGAVVFLVIAAFVTVTVLGLFTPLDRSSPQATISGYFQALVKQDDARAWQFAADSQNDPTAQSVFIGGLQADDQRYGHVVSFQVTSLNSDGSGHAQAIVAVKRANAPTMVVSYQVTLTQFDGTTWLIDNVSGS